MTNTTRDTLVNKIRTKALGNSNITPKEVASDLCNKAGRKQVKAIAEGTFLAPATVKRVMDCDENYRPQQDTLDRIFRYFDMQATFTHVRIQSKYRNKPKKG